MTTHSPTPTKLTDVPVPAISPNGEHAGRQSAVEPKEGWQARKITIPAVTGLSVSAFLEFAHGQVWAGWILTDVLAIVVLHWLWTVVRDWRRHARPGLAMWQVALPYAALAVTVVATVSWQVVVRAPWLQPEAAKVEANTAESLLHAPEGHSLDEYVCITNSGDQTVHLLNWRVSDAAGTTFTVPDVSLKPDESVRLHTGSGTPSATDLYWGRTQAVWNDDVDVVVIKDANGDTVSEEFYARPAEGKTQGTCGPR